MKRTKRELRQPRKSPKVVCITTGKRYQPAAPRMSWSELYTQIRTLRESLEAAYGMPR